MTSGERLGPYEILAQIGAGGMGEVYRARDTRLHRTVAIKILPRDKLSDAGRKRRKLNSSGTPVALRRSRSLAQLSGRYKRHAMGTLAGWVATDKLTATRQLSWPTGPQY